MSTCETQVLVSDTECDVITIATPGPQGPTGPIGAPGPNGPALLFNQSLSFNLASGNNNDLSPAGYIGGMTNRLIVTPASGGSTLTGLSAAGIPDGFPLLLFNASDTDTVTITYLDTHSALANRFVGSGGAGVALSPLASTIISYVANEFDGDYWITT